jgi:hypothetical protein
VVLKALYASNLGSIPKGGTRIKPFFEGLPISYSIVGACEGKTKYRPLSSISCLKGSDYRKSRESDGFAAQPIARSKGLNTI